MRGLLLSLLIPAILAQTPSPKEPQPFSYQWTVNSNSDTYVDHVETLRSIGAEGLNITWTPFINGTCNDAILCVKYLLAPIPNKDTWDTTHCSTVIKPLTTTPQPIYPRMGLHHFYLYRSTCIGNITISGKACNNRIFDGKKCEEPDEKAVKKLNSGIIYAPFTIQPNPTRADLGHVTFIINNPSYWAKSATITINATGPLDLIGRYAAIPRLTPPTYDFNYTSTFPISTLSKPYDALKYANAKDTTTDTELSCLYYITLINRGIDDVIVNNISAIIENCPDGSHVIGDKCVKYNSIISPLSSNLFKPTIDSEWQFFAIEPEKIKNSFSIIIQKGLKDKDNVNPILPDVYIRTRAYPRNEADKDGSFADNYDLYIPSGDKEYIHYESGTTDISDTWYLGLRVAGGVVPPVWITSGQQCAGETDNQCSGQGECINHFCQCKYGFIGPSCGTTYSPSNDIELSNATNYILLMIGLFSPIIIFFVLRRHLRKIVNRPSMASQGVGLGMGGPGHVVGGNIQDDDRRWQ